MTYLDFSLRLGYAFLLGAFIGLERQYKQKSAGLRTNTLVSIGSAGFILLSLSLTDSAGDPSRVAGQIVTGIGFLGAGVIMKTGLSIQGLNTAATIWCSAAVGTLAGTGLWIQAALMAFMVMLANIALRPLGMVINRLPGQKEEPISLIYRFHIKCKEQVENHLRVLVLSSLKQESTLQLRSLNSLDAENPAYSTIEAEIYSNGKNDVAIEKIAGKITLEYGVVAVRWSVTGQGQDS